MINHTNIYNCLCIMLLTDYHKEIKGIILTIHGHFINLCWVVLFNISQDTNIIILHKVDSNTFPSKTTRSTNTVNVQLTIVWQVIINDQGYLKTTVLLEPKIPFYGVNVLLLLTLLTGASHTRMDHAPGGVLLLRKKKKRSTENNFCSLQF